MKEAEFHNLTPGERLKKLESLPRRHAALHWAAFALSLLSFIILATWVFSSQAPVPTPWILIDIGLGIVFIIEYITRSGFQWDKATYLLTHFSRFHRHHSGSSASAPRVRDSRSLDMAHSDCTACPGG